MDIRKESDDLAPDFIKGETQMANFKDDDLTSRFPLKYASAALLRNKDVLLAAIDNEPPKEDLAVILAVLGLDHERDERHLVVPAPNGTTKGAYHESLADTSAVLRGSPRIPKAPRA